MAPDTPPQRSENQEESDSERPRKRARRTSDPAELPTLAPPASTSPPPTLPTAFLPIHHPSHYTPPGAPPTAFQLPTHLTSFSYSPTRELLMGARKDEAIAHYAEPRLGADLNTGFEECVWRDDTVDEGLDSLLDTLSNFEEDDSTGAARDILERNHVVTWRGMITKFMLAAYEFESANRGRADGWEMNAMVIDGTLYLEEAKSPAKIAAKSASESSYKLQSYYGYAFEAFSTVPPPPEPLPTTFVSPNTNVQWCSVVKTNLGGFRTILGGEVDCVLPTANMRRITTEDFVELKTNMTINSPRDEVNFERLKLLKHYTQSFLLGVPRVIVGFRTRQGQLTALQTFKTLEMPRLVRGKPHGWDPLACLSSAQKLLSFTFKSIKSNNAQLEYQAIFNDLSSSDSLEAVKAWPVFRLSFSPTGHDAGISLRQLSEEEVKTEVIEGKKKDDRVGFLLERWVAGQSEPSITRTT
ncbi:RAI1-domain-containing protein [Meredithblackwellia eburnea MCA 4105]